MFEHDVVFLQRLLKSLGFYTKAVDGIAGQGTKTAMKQFKDITLKIKEQYGEHDSRSEENIATLHPLAQIQSRKFLRAVLEDGIPAKIICGTRTYAEQNALYALGRSKPGQIVTKAKGGQSWHNFCLAWDVGIFKGRSYLGSSPLYETVGKMGIEMGLDWGGTWSFYDPSHLQLRLDKTIADVRKMFEKGIPILPWNIAEL
jgi:peptidoglycan LD-endopeptidase CwlK